MKDRNNVISLEGQVKDFKSEYKNEDNKLKELTIKLKYSSNLLKFLMQAPVTHRKILKEVRGKKPRRNEFRFKWS